MTSMAIVGVLAVSGVRLCGMRMAAGGPSLRPHGGSVAVLRTVIMCRQMSLHDALRGAAVMAERLSRASPPILDHGRTPSINAFSSAATRAGR